MAGASTAATGVVLGGYRSDAALEVREGRSVASSGSVDPHALLIAATQAELRGDIARGAAPRNASKTVICPICTYLITVTADSVV